MIWWTVDHAAERMGVTATTIRRWVRAGDLPSLTNPLIPGVTFVDGNRLHDAEKAAYQRRGGATRFQPRQSA